MKESGIRMEDRDDSGMTNQELIRMKDITHLSTRIEILVALTGGTVIPSSAEQIMTASKHHLTN